MRNCGKFNRRNSLQIKNAYFLRDGDNAKQSENMLLLLHRNL